jgi:hypothetical protein
MHAVLESQDREVPLGEGGFPAMTALKHFLGWFRTKP